MKILVTGARGFLGRRIVAALVARGHSVDALERRDAAGAAHRIDLRDAAATTEGVQALRPDLIVHAAGRLPHTASADELFAIHVLGTIHLLEAARAAGVPRFVSIGSAAEYGLCREPVPLTETADCRPTSAYGRSKLLQSMTAQCLLDTYALSGATLRVFNLFGADQASGSVMPDMIARLCEASRTGSRIISLPRPGDVRDYLPVEVAAELVAELAVRDDCRGVCNVCSGRPTRMSDVARWAGEAWNWHGEVQWTEPNPVAQDHCSLGDVTKLSDWLGRAWTYDSEPDMRRIVRQARDAS